MFIFNLLFVLEKKVSRGTIYWQIAFALFSLFSTYTFFNSRIDFKEWFSLNWKNFSVIDWIASLEFFFISLKTLPIKTHYRLYNSLRHSAEIRASRLCARILKHGASLVSVTEFIHIFTWKIIDHLDINFELDKKKQNQKKI